jgi:hypothetical protein
VRGAKPGATVLASVAPPGGTSYPALVVQRFGAGRAGALLIGDLWRWSLGRAELEPDLARFWRQTTRWLVTDVPGRVSLSVERRVGEAGQAVLLRARVRDRAFRPAEEVSVTLEVSGPGAEKTRLPAPPAAAEAGTYEASYLPRRPGGYLVRAQVTEPGGASAGEAEAGFALDLEAEEHRSIRANPGLLEGIARKTGGQMVALAELEAFARDLPRRGAPITDPRTRPLWHGWIVFLTALVLVAVEWTLRRRRGLA